VNADPNVPLNQMPASLRSELPHGAAVLDDSAQNSEAHRYSGLQLWMRRLAVLMFVFLCAVAGVLLVILPWRPEWTDNHFLLGSPWLRAFVSSGFVRGLCSGLGLLDIWIGFWEAVHYHE
jgi:hypothetical protein